MQSLSQSAFLQALGYAIANSLWQAALLWVLAAVSTSVIKMPSQVKYKLALAAQFGIFVWFVITLQFYYTKCSEANAQLLYSGLTNANALVLHPGTGSFSAIMLSAILKGEMLLPYLSIGYLCLLIGLAVRWVKGYRQTMVIKTVGLQKIDVEWRLFVKRIADLIGIKKDVHIYISELVKSPLTIGFLKPLILVPLASINSLTTYQLEAVILHELAHIKRADYVINIIQSIIETALFFNPFTQLLSKMIKRERENSCDDWVLQFQYDPSTYAEALLRIAYLQHAPAMAMNAAAGKEGDLLWRVKRMLNQQQKTFQYRNRLVALVMITGILTSVAWLQPTVKPVAAKQPVKPSTQPVVVEPMAARIDNMWFNPVSFLNKPLQAEVNKAVEDAKANLEASTQLSLTTTTEALQKVTPAVMETLKTVNVTLPDIMSAAGTATNNAIDNINVNNEVNTALKGLKDSLNVGNIIKMAVNDGLKNVNWADVNKEFKQSEKELKIAFANKDSKASVGSNLIQNLVFKSLNAAKNSIYNVKLTSDDNNDGDEDAVEIVTPNSTNIKAPAPGGSRAVKIRQRILQATKKKADSLRRAVSRIKITGEPAANLYATTTTEYDAQGATEPTAITVDGYSLNTPTYIPAKFSQNLPYNLSVGASNAVTVTSKGTSTLIAVKEDDDNTDSFKKRITIETLDSTGQRHVYHVTFEMYQ